MAKAKPFKPFNLDDLDIYKDGSISQEDVDILIPFGDYNSNLYDSPGAILKEIQKLQSLDEDEINFSGIDAISKPKKKFIEEKNKAINFLTNKYEKFTGGDEPDYRGEPDKAARQDAVDMVKVSKALQEYQAETGYDISKYQSEIQANIQQYQSDLSKKQVDFETSMAKYTAEYQKVSSDNQSKIALFNSEIQNYSIQVQKEKQELQIYIDRLNNLKTEYNEAFILMNPQRQQEQGRRQ